MELSAITGFQIALKHFLSLRIPAKADESLISIFLFAL